MPQKTTLSDDGGNITQFHPLIPEFGTNSCHLKVSLSWTFPSRSGTHLESTKLSYPSREVLECRLLIYLGYGGGSWFLEEIKLDNSEDLTAKVLRNLEKRMKATVLPEENGELRGATADVMLQSQAPSTHLAHT